MGGYGSGANNRFASKTDEFHKLDLADGLREASAERCAGHGADTRPAASVTVSSPSTFVYFTAPPAKAINCRSTSALTSLSLNSPLAAIAAGSSADHATAGAACFMAGPTSVAGNATRPPIPANTRQFAFRACPRLSGQETSLVASRASSICSLASPAVCTGKLTGAFKSRIGRRQTRLRLHCITSSRGLLAKGRLPPIRMPDQQTPLYPISLTESE